MSIKLVHPNSEMEVNALDFKQEFYDSGEKAINGSFRLDNDKFTYSEWVQMINNNLDQNRFNPKFGFSHTLFAIRDDGRIVGIINFRHTITEFYKDSGHIGYSVRPTERKKGYATEMLRQVLEIARSINLTKVILTCRKDNEASRKTIISNSGILQRSFLKNQVEHEEYVIVL